MSRNRMTPREARAKAEGTEARKCYVHGPGSGKLMRRHTRKQLNRARRETDRQECAAADGETDGDGWSWTPLEEWAGDRLENLMDEQEWL